MVTLTDDGSGGGIAKVYAADFNAGSHDAGCGPIANMQVIRMDHLNGGRDCAPTLATVPTVIPPADKFSGPTAGTAEVAVFDDFVKFCCADEGENMVVLRVYDSGGLSNDCMVNVNVQNKFAASISCQNFTVKCTEFSGNHLDFNGVGTGGSDCVPQGTTLFDVSESVNSCGVGSIVRTYSLDGTTSTCTSTITLTADGAFDPTTIRWPFHYDDNTYTCLLYTSPSPRDATLSRMPSSA